MKATYKAYAKTEITKMFDQFNIFFYICGLKKFWIADLKLPIKFVKIFNKLLVLSDVLMPILMLSNFLAVFTQNDITPRQSADIKLLCFTLPVIYHHFYALLYYRTEVRYILYHLAVILKEYYSDKDTEMQMVKNMKLYVGLYCFSSSSALVHRGVGSLLNVIMYGKTFNPFVAVWPDVNDSSPAGLAVRVVNYIAIWCYGLRSNGTYGMILVILMSLSYQFKDLQNYFNSLNHIFEDDNLSQVEKEQKFEEGFKRGIYLHALSLWCVRQCQHVCRSIFNVQLVFSMCILMAVMRPFVNSESFAEKLAQVPMIGVILIILAIIMWNSGNITFEAQCVANAMYASGWHNCYGMSSVRIRKLVVNAMLQAQQPVVLTGFGIVHMSYENYVKVVKTSYSIFSVFY